MSSDRPLSLVSKVTTEKDTTKFVWTVGRFKTVRFGEAVQMNTAVIAGGQKWKFSLYPKGILETDWASLFVTNLECSMDEGDPVDKNKITTTTLASITVIMRPNLPGKKKKGGGKDQGKSDDSGSVKGDGASSTSRLSAVASSIRDSLSGSGGSKSQKSSGSQGGGDGGKGQAQEVVKKLSQQFTNKAPSWGWGQYLDLDKLYNCKSGYLNNGEVRDASNIMDGSMDLEIEILAITGIDYDDPIVDLTITPSGCQRTSWTIRDFNRLTKKVNENQKLSSPEFQSDGDWFFDLYAKGYKPREEAQAAAAADAKKEYCISFFLHSTRSQVEHKEIKKQSFKLGIRKAAPLKCEDDPELVKQAYALLECTDPVVYFPPRSALTARFDPDAKCFGKLNFVPLHVIESGRKPSKDVLEKLKALDPKFPDQLKGELVAGKYLNGGSVTFVLDMAVTDEEQQMVQQNLLMIEAFGNDVPQRCSETQKVFKTSGITSAWCRWCGKHFCADLLRVSEVSRLPFLGYEVGREFLMDRIMREEEHQLFKLMAEVNVEKKYQKGMVAMQKKVWETRLLLGKDPPEEEEVKVSALERRKLEQEAKTQKKFHEYLMKLREEMEDATFAKPVCSRCFEGCKELHSLRLGPNKSTTAMAVTTGKKKDPLGKPRPPSVIDTMGWKKIKKQVEEEFKQVKGLMSRIKYDSSKLKNMDGRRPGRNAAVLVRGGFYVDAPELTKQCRGRVHPYDPLDDDDQKLAREARTAFCDVRFDCIEDKPGARTAPKQVHCMLTGRVTCGKCARWHVITKEFYRVPGLPSATPVPVSIDGKLEREAGDMTIQPVSQKQAGDADQRTKKVVKAAAVEEEEDDGEPKWIVELRKVPFCGEQIADKINPEG